jgi:tRNA-dihydrouridine synthase B
VPVTLKIRTGWDPQHRNGVRVARIAEDCGVQALAVHGRTRACRFRGAAEYETIANIKSSVAIPVIANGDINTLQKSLEVLCASGADAVMIGRAAQGRPWFFRELDHYLKFADKISPLENNEVRDIMLDHLGDLYQFYGDSTGVRVARKHLTWYCAGLKNSASYRSRVVRVESTAEQLRLTREFFESQEDVALLAA